jgi:hypothetical protein
VGGGGGKVSELTEGNSSFINQSELKIYLLFVIYLTMLSVAQTI